MKNENKLDSITQKQLNINVNAAQFFNQKSKEDKIGFVMVPFPFKPLEFENNVFDEYLDYLNSKKPNLNLDNIFNGNYLKDFLLKNNYNSYGFITLGKLPIRILDKVNFTYIEVFPLGHRKEITKEDAEILELYGLKGI